MRKKTIVIIGADGFIGWPLTRHLASTFDVIGIDNFQRRRTDGLTGVSLCPLPPPAVRFSATPGIEMIVADLASSSGYNTLRDIMKSSVVDAVVHLGQIRSAPYSMIDVSSKTHTLTNNTNSTLNILECVRDYSPATGIIHIGSMGVYGYASPVQSESNDIHHHPGSIYHATKCFDHVMFEMYSRLYGLKILDLHQGIVWGSQTALTLAAPELINRYDYDHIYGTVINRFIAQAASGNPLVLYGNLDQSRSFIHISDSIECISAAIDNIIKTSTPGLVVANQFTEIISIVDIAKAISDTYSVDITTIPNPRIEVPNLGYTAPNDTIKSMLAKLDKTFKCALTPGLIDAEFQFASKYISAYDPRVVMPTILW